jgi:RNA-directed DNA polymerase
MAFDLSTASIQPLPKIREKCRNLNINWILSADITGLFDNIEHGLLRDLIRLRVNDGGILRLIGKWLNAGVAEGGEITYPLEGNSPRRGGFTDTQQYLFALCAGRLVR